MKAIKPYHDFSKYYFVVLIVIFFSSQVFSKKIGNLNGVLKPFMLRAGVEKLFISDQHSVSFYSIDSLKLLKTIGGKGEGPGQFMEEPYIKVQNERVLIHSLGRSIFYTYNGELLKQIKHIGEFYDINSVSDNYIVFQMKMPRVKEKYYFFSIIVKDSNFNDIKIIDSMKSLKRQPKKKKKIFLVEPVFTFQSFNDKIYCATDKEGKFIINVYSHNGLLLKKIQKEYDLIRISNTFKKKKLDELKNHPILKAMWSTLMKRNKYCFPEYFPAIADIRVRDNKIYVKTFKAGKNGVEFIILDLQGRLQSSSFLPDLKTELWDIRNNHFYYLHSNEDLEIWELHSIKIQHH